MGGKRSDAFQAAQERLRQRLDGQLRIVQAFVKATEQLEVAERRVRTVQEENEARVKALQEENLVRVRQAEEAVRTRKGERAEALAGLAAVVNDDDETASLVEVSPAEVRAARRSVPTARAREIVAQAARKAPAASSNGSRRPPAATASK